MRVLLLALAACGSSAPEKASATDTSPPRSAKPAPATPCGSVACNASELCIPGGPSRNGIGETVMLPPSRCIPIPAACKGVATCDCVGNVCALGGCASIEAGRVVCLAG